VVPEEVRTRKDLLVRDALEAVAFEQAHRQPGEIARRSQAGPRRPRGRRGCGRRPGRQPVVGDQLSEGGSSAASRSADS